MAYTGDQTPGFIKGGATAVTGKGTLSGMYTAGGATTTKKPTQQKALLGNLIARLLKQIATGGYKGATAQQTEAAKGAFIKSYAQTLNVTPKPAWNYVEHPGVSDYYASEIQNMIASGRTKPEHAEKSILALQTEWARRAERSPYMTYPSGGVAAGKAHIPPYLEAGGLVSSYEYIANNPEYADYLYDKDPDYADRILSNLYIPNLGITYGGMDERVRTLWERAIENLRAAKARRTPQWMGSMPETPPGTLPSWVQATQGMTTPKW